MNEFVFDMNKLHSGSLIQVEEQKYIVLGINNNFYMLCVKCSDKPELSEIETKAGNSIYRTGISCIRRVLNSYLDDKYWVKDYDYFTEQKMQMILLKINFVFTTKYQSRIDGKIISVKDIKVGKIYKDVLEITGFNILYQGTKYGLCEYGMEITEEEYKKKRHAKTKLIVTEYFAMEIDENAKIMELRR